MNRELKVEFIYYSGLSLREGEVRSKMSSIETTEGRFWQCSLCNYSHKKKTNVVDHIEKHFDKISCEYCGKWFTRTSSLRQHHKICQL